MHQPRFQSKTLKTSSLDSPGKELFQIPLVRSYISFLLFEIRKQSIDFYFLAIVLLHSGFKISNMSNIVLQERFNKFFLPLYHSWVLARFPSETEMCAGKNKQDMEFLGQFSNIYSILIS